MDSRRWEWKGNRRVWPEGGGDHTAKTQMQPQAQLADVQSMNSINSINFINSINSIRWLTCSPSVQHIYFKDSAFSALKAECDGMGLSMLQWRLQQSQGAAVLRCANKSTPPNLFFQQMKLTVLWCYEGQHQNQLSIARAEYATSVLKSDGSVPTWGDAYRGGDSSRIQNQLVDIQEHQSHIYANNFIFAALKADGRWRWHAL